MYIHWTKTSHQASSGCLKEVRKKQWKIIKLSPQKVAVVILYYMWSVMRYANYRAFTRKNVVFQSLMGGSWTWRFNCNQIFMDWGKYPRHIHKNDIVHKFKCRFCIKQFWDSEGYKKVNHDSFGLYLGLSWYVAWTHITIRQKHGFKSVVEDNPLSPHTGQKKQNIFVSLHLLWSELWLKCCLTHQWKPGNKLRSFGSIIKEMNTTNHSLHEKRGNIIGLHATCVVVEVIFSKE